MGFLTKKLSIEFSTSLIKIVREGKLSLSEKTLIAIDDSGNVIAFGNSVDEKKHKTIINPIRNGVIADFNAFEQLLRLLIKKSLNKSGTSIFTPSLTAFCLISDSSTEVEIRAVRDALEHAGARSVYMMYSSIALIEGIGIDKHDSFLLLDAGAGKIGFTIINRNRAVFASKLDFGTEKIRRVLSSNIRKNYNIDCNEESLQDILNNYLIFNGVPKINTLRINGTDKYGAIISSEIDLFRLNETIQPYYELILHEVQLVLDVYNNESNNVEYICITGGFSKLHGFEKKLSLLTDLRIINKSDSDYALKGLLKLDSNFETNKNSIR